MKLRLAVAYLLIIGPAAYAQGVQPPYEKVLIPIMTTSALPGAYGSMWTTELVVRNGSDQYVEIENLVAPCQIECPIGRPPHATFRLGETTPDPNAGEFLYVGAPGLGRVIFWLRVQDLSRQAQTWGTAIPVVRESDVFSSTLQLLDIPIDSRFRATLRVYDFDTAIGDHPRQVRVRILDMCGIGPIDRPCSNGLLAETTLSLVPTTFRIARDTQYPATAIIGNLVAAFPQLANVQPPILPVDQSRPATVRLAIDPVTPGLRFWAFVSVTNNETQHVTVIAPQ